MNRETWKRSRRIEAAVTPVEEEEFKAAARSAGQSLSDWLRTRLRAAAKREARRRDAPPPPT